VANDLRLPPSSLSRRFDRLEEEGWIARHRHVDEADLRAVEVELTRTGRRLWREMNLQRPVRRRRPNKLGPKRGSSKNSCASRPAQNTVASAGVIQALTR